MCVRRLCAALLHQRPVSLSGFLRWTAKGIDLDAVVSRQAEELPRGLDCLGNGDNYILRKEVEPAFPLANDIRVNDIP